MVNTFNRFEHLKVLLEKLGELTYPHYEVIVVNGPSTDGTERIKELFPCVKYLESSIRNLSVSRNQGLEAAAGDYVAFIDDDAYPEPDWLDRLLEVYRDHPGAGGAGGRVYGPGDDHFQFQYGHIDRWGNPKVLEERPGTFNDPDGERFNIMMGTNCSFSREALIAVGGFDERFEYYHDESDLCLRIIRAGFRIHHSGDAYVHHEFAKSYVRKSPVDVNWTTIVKNHIYFAMKHGKDRGMFRLALLPGWYAFACRLPGFFRWTFRDGIASPVQLVKFLFRAFRGLVLGYGKGLFLKPRHGLRAMSREFIYFRKADPGREVPLRRVREGGEAG